MYVRAHKRLRRRRRGPVGRIAAVLVLSLLAQQLWAGGTGELTAPGGVAEPSQPPLVDDERLQEHINYLASDELAGRMVGTPGIENAEHYIIEEFRAAGLEFLPGTSSYVQEFELRKYGFERRGTSLSVRTPGVARVFRGGAELRALPFSGSGRKEGELVYAGYGIVAPDAKRDDYAGLDLTGKIAVVLRGEPTVEDVSSPFHGEEFTEHAYFSTKAERAYEAGAEGLVVVDVPGRRDTPLLFATMPSFTLEEEPPPLPPELTAEVPEGFLAVHAGSSLLEVLADARGIEAEELVGEADAGPVNGQTGDSLLAQIQVTALEPTVVAGRNILGHLSATRDGSEELLVIGAHHDHLGSLATGEDRVYNGADDNASGVATVLEIARLMSLEERSMEILFVTFSAEEYGLLGARHLVESGVIDLSRVVGMINFDMVGRNPGRAVQVHHNGRGHFRTLDYGVHAGGLEFQVESEERAPSDQLVFHRAGTPTLFFFTGLHEDYHGLDDELGAIDAEHHARVTEFALSVVRELTRDP